MTIDDTTTPRGQGETQALADPASSASPTPTVALPPSDDSTRHSQDNGRLQAIAVAEGPREDRIEAPLPYEETAEPKRSPARDDSGLFEAAMRELEVGDSAELEGSVKKLAKGDRVEATVIQVDRDRVFVDLGTKSEGIVPLSELSDESLDSAHEKFSVGDKISVVVIRPENADGNAIVSKRRADFELAWDRIEDAYKSHKMITAQVVDRVKGGLVVDVGVRGFVPATHVGSGKLRNIEKFVGQPLQLKVIEIDRERKKVVLSNREAEEHRRATAKDEIFKNVTPGDILDGTVRRLTDYGAFVDLGGVDGLLHISEMSWARISHPKEMFREGQKIKVMVLRLDPGTSKISLGHRQVLPDPWNLIRQNYTVGQRLNVKVSRLVQSGAFIKLSEGAEAFLPVSEMSARRLKRPQDAVAESQDVEVQVIDLRPDERRMVLSIRALGGGDRGEAPVGYTRREPIGPPSFDDEFRGEKRSKKKGKKGGRASREVEDELEETIGRRGYATGGATIGERLGMLKGFLGKEDDEALDEELAEPTEEPEETPEKTDEAQGQA